jgi:hypothetical protein
MITKRERDSGRRKIKRDRKVKGVTARNQGVVRLS